MRTLAGYEIGSELGKGGMGRVLRVRHLATGIERALKVMDGVSGPEAVARFRREAEALAKASGAGAVPIHESGLERGAFWYVMDLMTGGSLRDRMVAAGGALDWRAAAGLMARIARIVDRCHAMGLVHRDLKPENVLFDDSGTPRLADFGCVRDSGARSLTEAGELLGTLTYMAPEQLNGVRVDGRADVFALGVILHELVAGERPFRGGSWSELAIAVAQGARQPLTGIAGVPDALEEIVRRATAVEAGARYQTASDLAAALDLVVKEERVEPASSPLRLLVPLVLIALGLAGLAGTFLVWKSRRGEGVATPASATTGGPSSTGAVLIPTLPVARTVDPATLAAATSSAKTLGETLTVEQAYGEQREIQRAVDAWLRLGARVREMPADAVAAVLSPCIVALRRIVCTIHKPSAWLTKLHAEVERAFRPLGVLPRALELELAMMGAFLIPEKAEVEQRTGDELLVRARGCEDPLLVTAATWIAGGCWLRAFERDGKRPPDHVVRRAFAIDSESVALFAKIPEGDSDRGRLAAEPMRPHYESLRELHKRDYGHIAAGPEQEREGEELIRCAVAATTGVQQDSGAIAQGFLILLELAPKRTALVKPYYEKFSGVLGGHVLYAEYVRLTLSDPEGAIQVAAERRRRLEREPANERDKDRAWRIGELRDLTAIEANALIDLRRFDEARDKIAAVKRLFELQRGNVIRACHPVVLEARLAAAAPK
ncbi:MAG: protein kinase [Planctomycetota bacterium]